MSVIREIINGYSNYFLGGDKTSQKTAQKRAAVCAKCQFAKKGLHAAILPDLTLSKIQGYYCSKCGCPLSPKVRSETSRCPLKKW